MHADSLGDRMKLYEQASRSVLPGRCPVIIRVDGKAFHTYTKNLGRPVDHRLVEVMNDTAIALCKGIQGAQLAYVQSDEISVLVHGYKTFESSPWFDNQIQKMVSVSAGLASATFTALSPRIWAPAGELAYSPENIRPAVFDSRAFVVPEADVNNYFLWRQKDAVRNSIQTLARFLYSHKECDNKNNLELQEMCQKRSRPWSEEPTAFRRGRCILKETYLHAETQVERSRWTVDNEIPIFSEDSSYVKRHLVTHEEESQKNSENP